MEDWLTTYEAAQISGYNPDNIRQLIRSDKVQEENGGYPSRSVGSLWKSI